MGMSTKFYVTIENQNHPKMAACDKNGRLPVSFQTWVLESFGGSAHERHTYQISHVSKQNWPRMIKSFEGPLETAKLIIKIFFFQPKMAEFFCDFIHVFLRLFFVVVRLSIDMSVTFYVAI